MSRRSDEYAMAYARWGGFTRDFRKYIANKQMYFLGQVYITFTKHFIQRVVERAYRDEDESTIRRMLYHTANTRMCEILFWHYSDDQREILIERQGMCIIISRGYDGVSLIVRTFYQTSKAINKSKYFYLKL